MIYRPNLEENGFTSKPERIIGGALVGLVNFMLLFLLIPLALFVYLAWWIIIPVIVISLCCIHPSIFKRKPVKKAKCVICCSELKPEHESRQYRGAHEWCENYY